MKTFLLLLLAVVLTGSSTATAQTTAACTYQFFSYPGAQSNAHGINRFGNIVGDAFANGTQFGFVRYADGTFKKIMYPGSQTTQLFRRNASGTTVGLYVDGGGVGHGLVLSNGTFKTLDHPGSSGTVLTGINMYGTIVGYFYDASGHYRGFKYKDGAFTPIQYPNSAHTAPMAISDTGVVTGSYGNGFAIGAVQGFVLANGKFASVNDPGAAPLSTFLNDVNASGVIVGTGYSQQGGGWVPHAFRLRNGTVERLAVPGAFSAGAEGINGYGVIVGWARFADGSSKSYIARCN